VRVSQQHLKNGKVRAVILNSDPKTPKPRKLNVLEL